MQNYKIGSGLSNLGNTCFLNAVLQSIIHTQPLANNFKDKSHSNNCSKQDWCIFCQMENVWQQTKTNKVYSPIRLVQNLKKIFSKFRLGRQQDSHQFLRYLIQGMQQSETGKMTKDRQKYQQVVKRSQIFKIFGGRIRTSVHCLGCHYKSLSDQRYYQINIECQRSSTLQQGIKSFFKIDELSGNNKYYCQNCKRNSNAQKRFYLMTAPQILTFQLKRFTNSLRKIGKHIPFPQNLSLSAHFQDQRKVTFNLYAVIVHAGYTSYSGHYYSFVKVNQAWYRMDDSHVTKCSQQSVLQQHAYILFYKKTVDRIIQPKHKKIQKSINIDQKIQYHKNEEVKFNIVGNNDFKKVQNIQITLDTLPNHNDKNIQQSIVNQNKNDDDDDQIQIPKLLVRRRSKQQAINSMPFQTLILKYAQHLMMLDQKLRKPIHRSLSILRNLRKYEKTMKKRKIA